MTSLTNRVATFILLFWLCTASALCPLDCYCRLDERGRRKTSCLQGGMIGTPPVSTIDKSTQVLEIQAPEGNPNWLLIGAVFQTLTALQELHVVRCNVPDIGKHSFWGIKGLEVLNFMENNISSVQDHNFRGLVNLRELYLNDNRIEHLASGTFKYLTELRVLSLARNRLEELVTRVFERLSKLQKLNLSGNRLAELQPEVFMDVQELRVLECRKCGLRNINTQIYHLLPHLTTLDLGDNDFFYLTNDEFYDLKKLRYLWLDGNHLPVVLEKTFIMQRELQKVSLARNRLAKVTNTAFANVSTLVELDISYNKLIRLEPAVFHPLAESLERLDLSGNHLQPSELKYSLQSLTNLRHIGLADLNLTGVPIDLVLYHERLRSLNLSGNLIETVDVELPLLDVDLSRNRFNGIDERTMHRLDRIPALRLDRNPWSCDLCNIVPLLTRVNRSAATRDLTCAYPASLSGRLLSSLHESELRGCHDEDENSQSGFLREHVVFAVGGGLGGLLIILGVAILLRLSLMPRRRPELALEAEKRAASHSRDTSTTATAVFGQNGEISFKFPLDKKVSISTIDEIKETKLSAVPNGEL